MIHYLAIALILANNTEQPEYHWPLDLPRVLTSSFAEFRPGRFHMGIDLRTGPPGKNVYAAADGYIARIRCSPYGYGKALYLQLNDGYSIVYAHLDDFDTPLREFLHANQHARKSYTVDLYPQPGHFPVKRGQLIAKSGSTGAGPPHLHYEIRDPSGNPINPRLIGVTWPDTTPPTFRAALAVPLQPGTTINGDLLPRPLDVRPNGRNSYTTDPIAVNGTIGFAVDVIDPVDGGAIRLGVHTIETRAGDQLLFRLTHDRVSYAESQHGAVAYHPYYLPQARYLTQYRWPGNTLAMYTQSLPSGAYAPQPGANGTVTITATDFQGNQATLAIPIQPEQPPAEPLLTAEPATGSISFDTYGDGLIVSALFNAPEPDTPNLLKDNTPPQPFTRVSPNLFRAHLIPEPGVHDITLAVQHPRLNNAPQRFITAATGGANQPRTLAWQGLQLTIPPNAPYGNLVLQIHQDQPQSAPELIPVGDAYTLWHPATPLRQSIQFSIPIPRDAPNLQRLRLYRRIANGWSLQSSAQQRNQRFHLETQTLGTYAILEDTTPPAIRFLEPPAATPLPNHRPPIRIRVTDQGSGINTWTLTANNQWLLAAYDPDENLIYWEQDHDLPPETTELVLRITDNAGNTATQTRPITLP